MIDGTQLFLFGHSMGSMLAQRFAQLRGAELAGLILSGTTGSAPNLRAGIAAAAALRRLHGDRAPSPLQRVMFADFNKPFERRSGFEWLSRDTVEVQKYADDPRCGFTFSNRFMLDMLRGYAQAWKPANERRIPVGLPVLMFSGSRDPVGGAGKNVERLAKRYRALGLRDVQVVIYPDARHETLNEINRDEVVRDAIAWLEGHL